jgi:hypothetical protein
MKPMSKHLEKPAKQKLFKLCRDPRFKERVRQIRTRRRMHSLTSLPSQRRKLLEALGKFTQEDWNYQDIQQDLNTQKQPLIREIRQLCADFNLPTDAWFLIFSIILCFDLENVKIEDFENLGMHPSIARIDTLYGLELRKRHHLYLDVTFASMEDIREIWPNVLEWQKDIRPRLIDEAKLPNLLDELKSGRPSISDYVCRECARLKDERRWTYNQLGKHFGFPLQTNAYGKRTQCRTAQIAVKRGRELIKNAHIN